MNASASAPVAHKFGGTSMAGAARIAHVAEILCTRSERQVVVVSAMQGVTDALLALVHGAARGEPVDDALTALVERHRAAASELLPSADATALHDRYAEERDSLAALLHAQAQLGAVSSDVLDRVAGVGEVWSSWLLHAALRAQKGRDAAWLDARDVLVVDKTPLGALVDWPKTEAKLAAWRTARAKSPDGEASCVVVTGFIARDQAGRITTLGRNGSDYSGAIFGALFAARELHIWTDVDGVLSADPRTVPEAVLLASLSYSEACELAYFGAKVIHPQTMSPAIARAIPIFIRNTFAPDKPGTRIGPRVDPSGDERGPAAQPIKGVTTIGGLAVVNIEGAGMIGVPGTAERAFEALQRAGVSVVMISQGSSEHSICVVVKADEAGHAQTSLRAAFAREVGAGHIHDVTVIPDVAALAVVGDGMAGSPGVAARLFGALGRARVNVRAIAQGASERNISVAIAEKDAPRALRAVHAGFYLSAQTLSIGVIGPGNVGGALLRQIDAMKERLRDRERLDLRVRAVARSKLMQLDGGPEVATDLDAFAEHVNAPHLPHALIIDTSASDAVADRYADWLAKGIHVVTANKKAGAGPWARYAAIRAAAAKGGARFLSETTVGAGLPIVQTLRDLVDTGDEVLAVEGILSGTLAYLFNRYDGSAPFSALVSEARSLGYTEPDPRDDLSGLDVARKLVILARHAHTSAGARRHEGLALDAVSVESLVPPALQTGTANEFLARLGELDAPMQARVAAARAKGCVLRYVARLEDGHARVGLVELPQAHAFAHIRLTDNVVQFTTTRYRDNPLIVQGPGAGPEVTAAGVFADVLRVATGLAVAR